MLICCTLVDIFAATIGQEHVTLGARAPEGTHGIFTAMGTRRSELRTLVDVDAAALPDEPESPSAVAPISPDEVEARLVTHSGRLRAFVYVFTRCTRGSPLESGAAVVRAGVRARGVGTVLKRPTDSGH